MTKFTKQELVYIEKIMDINASIGIQKYENLCKIRQIGFTSKVEKETVERMQTDLNKALNITNQIRDKIERVLKE